MKTDFFIYVLFRPDGRPCYVGKGRGKRWIKHARRSANPHLASIIALAGGELPAVRIRTDLTEPRAFEIERAFIAAIGRKANGGILVNMTDGGEGAVGAVRSEKTKEAIRLALKGKSKSVAHCKAMRGPRKPLSQDQRDAISARQTGRRHDESWKKAIGVGLRTSPKNDARRAAIGTAQRGIPKGPCTESRRLAAKAGALAYHQNKRAARLAQER